jgi:hypothetical protein
MSKPEAQFTQDWFSRSIPSWQFLLSRITQKIPHLRVLEVGVFEGKSTCWLLEKGLVQFRGENGEFALTELNRCYHCDD